MPVADLMRANRRWRFLLEIAGETTRYYSGRQAPSGVTLFTDGNGNALGTYDDVPAIDSVSAIQTSIDIKEPIAEGLKAELELISQFDAPVATDPARILGAVGDRAADFFALVIETIPSSWAGADVKIDRSPAAVSFPTRLQIGDETLWATGWAGTGSTVDPYRFTGIRRGIISTIPQHHKVDLDTGDQPVVTVPQIVQWEGRRATLYVADATADGYWLDRYPLLPGFISEPPRIVGGRVLLTLTGIPALLDTELTSQIAPTKLVHGWHYFTAGRGVVIEHLQGWDGGSAWEADTTANDNAGLGVISAPVGPYDATFDVNLPHGHPRHGRIIGFGRGIQPVEPLAVGHGPNFAVNGPSANMFAGDTVGNDRAVERKVVTLHSTNVDDPPAVLEWPKAAIDAIQAAWVPGLGLGRGVGSHLGAGGAWVDVALERDGNEARLACKNNCLQNTGFEPWIILSHGNSLSRFGLPLFPTYPPYLLCWYGLDFAPPDSEEFARHDAEGASTNPGWPARKHYIQAERMTHVTIRDIADGYYQAGEQFIFVEDDIPIPGGGSLFVEIEFYDRAAGETTTVATRIVGSSPVLHPTTGATLGYALELPVSTADRRLLRSFGDWPGQPRTIIRPTMRWEDKAHWQLLLELVESTAGQGVSGTFDQLPAGAGLAWDPIHSREDVDEASFRRVSAPSVASRWTFDPEDGETIREMVARVLTATNSALVLKRDQQGRALLTRIKLGLENKVEAVHTLEVFRVGDAAESGAEHDVLNVFETKLNHDVEGDAQLVITSRNNASIRRYGNHSRRKEIDLRGLYLADRSAAAGSLQLMPLLTRLMAIHGAPRRTWRVRVSTGDAVLLSVGLTVLVTSPYLWPARASQGPGVSEVPARIVDIRLGVDDETSELLLVSYGVSGTGYNAACEIVSSSAADTFTVAANRYRSTPHPVTGLPVEDLDYFAAGDNIRVAPRGDRDNAVSLTIVSVDRTIREVTASGAHGLAGPDWGVMIPDTYDAPASDRHKGLAYLADAAGTLGAAGDAGDDFT